METRLVTRDVEFNGAVLKAAQDLNNMIWVGIRWVCEGLGLSEGQTKRERKRLQDDLVLSKGGRNLVLPTTGGAQEVLCLQLDYLPLWLAKISITPGMKRDNPELVERLISYQLKAKDVLAAAFLDNKQVPAIQPNTVQLTLLSYDARFSELNQKIEKLNNDIGKFVNVMLDFKGMVGDPRQLIQDAIDTYSSLKSNLSISHSTISECQDWKKHIYGLADQLIRLDRNYKNRGAVLQHIYMYMNKKYGTVWEQEQKDYQKRYNCGKPSCIDVVFDKEMLRSIFESVLIDLVANTEAVKITDVDSLDEMIKPLIAKRNDKSKYGCATYRMVYRHMEIAQGVNWKNHVTRYMRENRTHLKPSKKVVVMGKPSLIKKFETSVNEIIITERSID